MACLWIRAIQSTVAGGDYLRRAVEMRPTKTQWRARHGAPSDRRVLRIGEDNAGEHLEKAREAQSTCLRQEQPAVLVHLLRLALTANRHAIVAVLPPRFPLPADVLRSPPAVALGLSTGCWRFQVSRFQKLCFPASRQRPPPCLGDLHARLHRLAAGDNALGLRGWKPGANKAMRKQRFGAACSRAGE